MTGTKETCKAIMATESVIYGICPDNAASDVQELLDMKLAHLDALLMMTWGLGGEAFRKQGVTQRTGNGRLKALRLGFGAHDFFVGGAQGVGRPHVGAVFGADDQIRVFGEALIGLRDLRRNL